MEITLLKALNEIVFFVKGPNDYIFDPELETLDCLQKYTGLLREKLGITAFQAAILGTAIEEAAGHRTNLKEVADALNSSYLEMISHIEAFQDLQTKGYIRMMGESITIPVDAMEALKNNRPYVKDSPIGVSSTSILLRLRKAFNKAAHDAISEEMLLEEAELLFKNNPETGLSMAYNKHIVPLGLGDSERYLFLLAVVVSYREDTELNPTRLRYFYNNESAWDGVLDDLELLPDSLTLVREKVLEYSSSDGLAEKNLFRTRRDILNDLFKDAGNGNNTGARILLEDSSKKPFKNLIYNKDEARQVKRLLELLDQDNLPRVFESMKAEGMRTGFTCLFYGDPGTGKTETAWQLAKATGRKVLCADVAALKGMFVGDSEKNTRRLFADYRAALEENELAPILLFNEADAILGVRMENTQRAVDKMENSVQNILLEEIENFSGILIATTNLTGNLDPAFERRFLYKVRFDKPGVGIRASIWKTIIPDLSEQEASQLANEFDFSGGQIENVARKRKVDAILTGHSPSFKTICRFCSEETLSNRPARKPIGF